MSESTEPWVAVVGDNTVDRYFGAESTEYSGGNAFNVAVQLARAGVRVRYFGAVADDDDASIIRRGLALNGIPLDDLVTLPGQTAVTDIRVAADGDRVFEREEFGVTADYFPTPAAVEMIGGATWVHIGMLPRATELRSLLADPEHPTISQDCAVAAGHSDLDVAFLSAGETADAESIAELTAAAGVPVVIVTRGADGALAYDGARYFAQESLPAHVIDTTGAGDSFIAGFIADRLTGGDISSGLAMGAKLAAATCGHPAGWPHPTLDQGEISA